MMRVKWVRGGHKTGRNGDKIGNFPTLSVSFALARAQPVSPNLLQIRFFWPNTASLAHCFRTFPLRHFRFRFRFPIPHFRVSASAFPLALISDSATLQLCTIAPLLLFAPDPSSLALAQQGHHCAVALSQLGSMCARSQSHGDSIWNLTTHN